MGDEWSNRGWDPLLPVFLVNRQASLSARTGVLAESEACLLTRNKQPVPAERCVHALSLRAVIFYIDVYDCSFESLRDQCALMGGTLTLCHHCCVVGLSGLSGGCLISKLVGLIRSSCMLHQYMLWRPGT